MITKQVGPWAGMSSKRQKDENPVLETGEADVMEPVLKKHLKSTEAVSAVDDVDMNDMEDNEKKDHPEVWALLTEERKMSQRKEKELEEKLLMLQRNEQQRQLREKAMNEELQKYKLIIQELQQQSSKTTKPKSMPTDNDGYTMVNRGGKASATAAAPPIANKNRFSPLVQNNDESLEAAASTATSASATVTEKKTQAKQVGGLYLRVDGVKAAKDKLQSIGIQVSSCILGSAGPGKVRVVASTESERERIHVALKENGVHHVRPLRRSERPLKVELKGLSDFTEQEVTEMMRECPHLPIKPILVVRTKRFDQRQNEKVNTPFFTVTFPAGTKLADLEKIRMIGNIMSSFQPVRRSGRSLHCGRCQMKGHMRDDCFNAPMCVKCGLEHLSKDCTIITTQSERSQLFCGQCKQHGHPANWSGCPKEREYQEKLKRSQQQQQMQSGRRQPQQQQQQLRQQKWFQLKSPPSVDAARRRFYMNSSNELPVSSTGQQQQLGAWANPPSSHQQQQLQTESVLSELLSEIRSLRSDMQQLRDVQSNMATYFGKRMNLQQQDIQNLIQPWNDGAY